MSGTKPLLSRWALTRRVSTFSSQMHIMSSNDLFASVMLCAQASAERFLSLKDR